MSASDFHTHPMNTIKKIIATAYSIWIFLICSINFIVNRIFAYNFHHSPSNLRKRKGQNRTCFSYRQPQLAANRATVFLRATDISNSVQTSNRQWFLYECHNLHQCQKKKKKIVKSGSTIFRSNCRIILILAHA